MKTDDPALRASLDNLKAQLEELRIEFVQEVKAFVAEFYIETARKLVGANPLVTDQLTDKKLSELKKAVSQLPRTNRITIEKLLGSSRAWWHLEDEQAVLDRSLARSGTFPASGPIDCCGMLVPIESVVSVLQLVNPVLNKYGYTTSDVSMEDPEMSFPGGWCILQEYGRIRAEASEALGRIVNARLEALRVKAKTRWEEA